MGNGFELIGELTEIEIIAVNLLFTIHLETLYKVGLWF